MIRNSNVYLRYLIMLISFLCAFTAQQVLLKDHFFPAGFFFIISILLFIFITRDFTASGLIIRQSYKPDLSKIKRKLIILGGVTLFSAILTVIFFVRFENNSIAWFFHFLSLISFVWMVIVFEGKKLNRNKIKITINFNNLVPLLIIIFIGILPRVIQLDQIPYGLWFDEADFGLNAIRILNEDGFAPVFFENSRVPAYYIYLLSISIKLFGPTIFSLRIVSAVFGILTIGIGYYCAKEMFNQKTALVFAFFLAVSRWNINWSRIGLDNVTIPFFELLIIFLLYLAISKKSYLYFSLAGISMGLGLSLYAAMRIFPFVIVFWLISISIFDKKFISSFWKEGIVFGIALFLTIIPIGQYAITEPENFWGRVNQTSIFTGKTTQEAWNAVGKTTKEHLLMFNYKGDRNGRHNLYGQPMLDHITAPLMVLGLGISLSRLKYPKYILVITWLLVMLVPGIFSLDFESPQSLRAIGSLPAAYLLAVIPINEVFRYDKLIRNNYFKVTINTLVVVVLMFVSYQNINIYFKKQMMSSSSWQDFSTRETIIAKRMNQIGNNVNYFVSTFFFNAPTIKYLAPHIDKISRFETYDLIPLDHLIDETIVIYLDGERKALFDLVQYYFKDGKFSTIKDPNGIEILYEIILEPSMFSNYQGLNTTYYSQQDGNSTQQFPLVETTLLSSWVERKSKEFSKVEWDGVLFAPSYGEYSFYFLDKETINIFIDGDEIPINSSELENFSITLAKGNHKILIYAYNPDGKFEIKWKPPGQPMKTLSTPYLYHDHSFSNGLIGKYYSSLDWTGEIAYSQIDPLIDFYYHHQPISRPYSAEWNGFITIPSGGDYKFAIRSRDESWFTIDDQFQIVNLGEGNLVEGSVFLDEGKYPINIKFIDQTGYTLISLYWAQPDSELKIISSEFFSIE